MWGNILTEVSYMQNFNMSFSNNKSDVLIHLTQWQYWWWFWFAFLWVLYYLLVARVFRYRTLKFNPRISSTLRPHGKWGDLLTCLIPVTWCANILVNSNFILKLIEWQSESSLFTLRVRAKQWYWIYKLDLRNIADIFSAPRNVGRNKWQSATFGDLQTAEDYLHIMQMRAYDSWSKDFWTELTKKAIRKNKFSVIAPIEAYKSEFLQNANKTLLFNILDKKNLSYNHLDTDFDFKSFKYNTNNVLYSKPDSIGSIFLQKRKVNLNGVAKKPAFKKTLLFVDTYIELEENETDKLYDQEVFKKTNKIAADKNSPIREDPTTYITRTWSLVDTNSFKNFFQTSILDSYNRNKSITQYPEMDDETRLIRRGSGKTNPIRVLKCPNTNDFFFKDFNKADNVELLRFRFGSQKAAFAEKPTKPSLYLTFKQKRYNQRNNIPNKINVIFDENRKKKQIYSGNPFLKNMSVIEENFGNPTRQYRMLKKAKSRLDTTKVANWNRLLRSRRVLVLPAHVNITVITNSFDVVHSWHIPGLGLKMDCLPGRATHHTMYIDNVGLYYGQCAEICGRYHHHMPIRVCALPFEHFLVWWHTFGLPKFLFPNTDPKNYEQISVSKYFTRKFSW